MSQPTFNSSPRAPIKIIPGATALVLSAPQKSLVKPAFISPLARLRPSGWPPPGMIDSSLAKNHFYHHPKPEKQKANVLTLPPGSFNH
jgi:hypothetical protein